MATQRKFLVFSFILAMGLILTTGIQASAKSKTVTKSRETVRESVTGMVAEALPSDDGSMLFLRITPKAGGEDVWVAVFADAFADAPVDENTAYTFEGAVYKNRKVKILGKKFEKIIYSSGPIK